MCFCVLSFGPLSPSGDTWLLDKEKIMLRGWNVNCFFIHGKKKIISPLVTLSNGFCFALGSPSGR
jgi:hypothetical protein